MNYFDPFDPNVRDRRKRRSKEQIMAEKAEWTGRIDDAFRKVLESMSWPAYVQGDFLLDDALQYHSGYCTLRRNMTASMERFGYTMMKNPNSKDGRWKSAGKNVTVFRKKGEKTKTLSGLKKYFDW